MQRYVKFLLLILVFILIFTISMYENLLFQKKDYVFGTIVDIKIYGESKKLASEPQKKSYQTSISFIISSTPGEKGWFLKLTKQFKMNHPFL